MAGNNGRVKKLRRSSINRWKRDLKIFDQNTRRGDDLNDNVKNMNSFENLLDDSYENLLAMESGEIPEVMVESESDNEGESARESTVEREATLENNDDFIAFGEDSSESENESGNEQEQESESECELSENESLARGLNPEFPWLLNHKRH